MKLIVLFSALLFVTVGLFQNCSVTHELPSESIELASTYPYSKLTEYYDDVQIVNKVQVEGVWSYQFAASVVSAMDEDSMVDVELVVSGPQDEIVCPRVMAKVNRLNNHIQVDSCESNTDFKSIRVQVFVAPESMPLVLLRTHEFDLSSL